MNLIACRPEPELASSKYCLACPGREYVVYLPAGKDVTLDLRAAPQIAFSVEWIHAVTGQIEPADGVVGGDWRSLQSPFADDAAVYLHRKTE